MLKVNINQSPYTTVHNHNKSISYLLAPCQSLLNILNEIKFNWMVVWSKQSQSEKYNLSVYSSSIEIGMQLYQFCCIAKCLWLVWIFILYNFTWDHPSLTIKNVESLFQNGTKMFLSVLFWTTCVHCSGKDHLCGAHFCGGFLLAYRGLIIINHIKSNVMLQ